MILRMTFTAFLLAFIAHIGWCFVHFAMEAPPSFDGGMNLNVALSFLQGKGYGFFYDIFYPFPAQTDGPFILPAVFVLWLGGITPFTTQLVNLLYLGLFSITVYILLRWLELPPWVALVGVILCLRTPGMSEFALNGFGEIPCLSLFLMGLIVLSSAFHSDENNNWKPLLGGILLGLCAITKTIGLIMVVPTAVVFVLLWYSRSRRWSWLLYFFSGIMLPVLGWELFRFVNIGSGRDYLDWWRLQASQVFWQAGVVDHIAAHVGAVAKAKNHLEILSHDIGVPVLPVMVWLVTVFVVGSILGLRLWRARRLVHLFILFTLSVVTGAYFFWWLFLTPTNVAWLRRIMNGLILLQMLSVFVVFTLIMIFIHTTPMRSLPRKVFVILVAFIVAATQMMTACHGGIFSDDPKPSNWHSEQMIAAKILRELPKEGIFFGTGWWKSPVLALFSGRQLMNYEHWTPGKIDALARKYLVLDGFAKTMAMNEFQRILDSSTYRVILESPSAAIYELISVKEYKPFQPSDYTAPNLMTGFDALKCSYRFVHGLYPRENHHRWSRPEMGFLLRRTNQDRLLLTISIPDELFRDFVSSDDLHLSVYSRRCINRQVHVVRGRQVLKIPLTCPATNEPVGQEIAVRINAHMPFIRSIEQDGRRLGFLFESVQLVDSKSPGTSKMEDCEAMSVSYTPPNCSDKNWVNGIAKVWASAFLVSAPIQEQTKRDFAVGRKAKFSDGTVRTIVKQEMNAGNLIVYVDGVPLDGNTVGHPKEIKISDSTE